MTRVEGENTRLRHYLARLHRKTLCYAKLEEMLRHSIRLLIHYLKFKDVPVPYHVLFLIQQHPGKGGLPPTVNEALNSELSQVGLIEAVPSQQNTGNASSISADNPDNHSLEAKPAMG